MDRVFRRNQRDGKFCIARWHFFGDMYDSTTSNISFSPVSNRSHMTQKNFNWFPVYETRKFDSRSNNKLRRKEFPTRNNIVEKRAEFSCYFHLKLSAVHVLMNLISFSDQHLFSSSYSYRLFYDIFIP